MDKPKTTPKDFFLWVGAVIALYVSVFSFISLLFEYINHAFPDALNSYVDPYSGGIRSSIAALVVLFPLFLILMRFIRNDMAKMMEKRELWVRRWAIFLTLFVGGATLAIDLITLVNTYLGGDLTARFGLKVLVVFLVVGGVFLHFLAEMRGYWLQYPSRARVIGLAAAAVIIIAIVSGFLIIGSPNQVRLYRFDDQKVNDLSNIQYQVVNYWQQKESLPASLEQLQDPLSGNIIPLDPQSGAWYTYKRNSPLDFALCATFNATSTSQMSTSRPMMPVPMSDKSIESGTWQHGPGEVCFDRSIDPQRYPPFSKTQ